MCAIFISRIRIQNIKGQSSWENVFDGLNSNKVNLFVAPNGFGKSTLTTAFAAASHGKMRLSSDDYYEGNLANVPKLEITYRDNDGNTHCVSSDNEHGDVSKAFSIYVINSPVYAKATGRNMGGYATQSAKLYIKGVEICKKPNKHEIPYRFSEMKQHFGRSTPNISSFFASEKGLRFILKYKVNIHKCASQVRIQSVLENTTSENADDVRKDLMRFPAAANVLTGFSDDFGLSGAEQVQYLLQLVKFDKDNELENTQRALDWIIYQKTKTRLDERLLEFNTTGLQLKSAVRNNTLLVEFGRAGRMSNGERDVLSFVANLIAFSMLNKSKPCILVIDEVFDYLDGANLLAVQYYLSQEINRIKHEGNTVFPILMTHLDPSVFSSYHFKGMAVHYLTNVSHIDLENNLVKLLQLRSTLKQNKDPGVKDLEKYLLHYHPTNWTIPDPILSQLPDNFWSDSQSLKEYLYEEVVHRYLNNQNYNAIAVILGLRLKIEEKTVGLLQEDCRDEYFTKLGSKEKLFFADEKTDNIPDVFYLLQPLYNEALHLRDDGRSNKENKNRIESAYLKLSSKIIMEMVRTVFQ